MIESITLAVFATGVIFTYLSLYRTDEQVEIPLLVSLSCWSILAIAGGGIDVHWQSEAVAEPLLQYFAIFLALIHGFALAGAVFGYYPTPSMGDQTTINDAQEQ